MANHQQQFFMGKHLTSGGQDEDDYRFVFTVNTGATSSSNKISAIPFDLNMSGKYNGETVSNKQDGVILTVDWGDGTTSTLTNSDYTVTNAMASTHTYSAVGTYVIKVDCNDWSKCYFCSSGGTSDTTVQTGTNDITPSNASNRNKHLAYWKQTLISIDSSIKNVPGILEYAKAAPSAVGDATFIDNSAHCLFYCCRKLTNLTPKVFMNMPNCNDFFSTFENADGIVTIPTGIFAYNTAATDFTRCFYRMANLEIVPSTLFQNCVNALKFKYLFCRSPNLIRIPKGIFDYNVNATIFTDIFHACTKLTEIPEDMFKYNTKATIFQSAFRATNIDVIPTGLFDGCTKVTSFQQCFSECKNLRALPADMFKYCGNVTIMQQAFYNCTSLASIDPTAFSGLVKVTNFQEVFSTCTKLTTVPNTLFENCNAAVSFQNAFKSCSNLTNVPTSILLNKPNVTNANSTFVSCNKIGNVEIHVTSKKISNCTSFIAARSGYDRIIYVPNNSTTKTKFEALSGLTIIGE